MRKLLPLLVLALVGAPGASAKGCSPSSCGTATVAVVGSPVLHVRPAGSHGPLLGYDLADGRLRFRLSSGLLAADGRTYLATGRAVGGTTLARYDARSGRLRGAVRIAGKWRLSALSANGRWAALLRDVVGLRRTTVRVADTRSGDTVAEVVLAGAFEAEAVDEDGMKVFLVQHQRGGYVVRSYDFALRQLATLRAKPEPALMPGIAWSALGAPDGRRLLTLYFAPDGESAVHTLDLARGRAFCIDIPEGDFVAQQRYALALARDGRTAYALNTALGVVATVDLEHLRVTRVVRFTPERAAGVAPGSTAAVSPDGAVVWFSSDDAAWRYDVRAGRVSGPFASGGRVLGLGFSPDGERLLVVRWRGTRMIAAR